MSRWVLYRDAIGIVLLLLQLTACGRPLSADQPDQGSLIQTQIAGTVIQEISRTAVAQRPSPTGTPLGMPGSTPSPTLSFSPTFSPVPVVTITASPSTTPIACNRAELVRDITISDGTSCTSGSLITKIWRLKNAGSCPWTADYALVFVGGDSISSQTEIPIPASVSVGQTIDLGIDLRAPQDPGNLSSYWMLRDSKGQLFGVGEKADSPISVKIEVLQADSRYAYDLALNYCLAGWRSGAGLIDCPDSGDPSAGFVTLVEEPRLENRQENEPALWVHPNEEQSGWISGTYPGYQVQPGDHFRAWLGCLADRSDCQVIFQLDYQIAGQLPKNLLQVQEVHDGAVTQVDLDLTELAGETVQFTLSVLVGAGDSEQAHAFWFVPRIERVDD